MKLCDLTRHITPKTLPFNSCNGNEYTPTAIQQQQTTEHVLDVCKGCTHRTSYNVRAYWMIPAHIITMTCALSAAPRRCFYCCNAGAKWCWSFVVWNWVDCVRLPYGVWCCWWRCRRCRINCMFLKPTNLLSFFFLLAGEQKNVSQLELNGRDNPNLFHGGFVPCNNNSNNGLWRCGWCVLCSVESK